MIVRPVENRHDDYGQLYLTGEGLLMGLRYANKCFLAYDFSKKRCLGHGEVEGVPPFALHTADSNLVRNDIESLRAKRDMPITERGIGYPHYDRLVEATTHANPEVRRVATLLLEDVKNSD